MRAPVAHPEPDRDKDWLKLAQADRLQHLLQVPCHIAICPKVCYGYFSGTNIQEHEQDKYKQMHLREHLQNCTTK